MLREAKSTTRFATISLLLGLGVAACSMSKTSSPALAPAAPVQTTPRPAWLPPYDQDLSALLALPVEAPVQLAAQASYPDLSRFTFTGESVLNVPDDLVNYASLIYRTIEQSPRLYVFRSAEQAPQNLVALYGPAQPDEPDLWSRSVSQPPSDARSIIPAPPAEEARPLLQNISSPPPASALDALTRAAALSPQSPGVHCLLAESALAAGDLSIADSASKTALQIDPFFPPAHRIQAEIAIARKDMVKAKASLSRSLALYPKSVRSWKVASILLGTGVERFITVQPPFIEVNSSGAILVVACDTPFCERYAACKAAFRFEPELRTAILAQGPTVPYHLSVTEEVICLEAGLGSYLSARQKLNNQMPSDPISETLIRLARERGLTSFALFDIVGNYRPDLLRTAPLPVHEALVRYVQTKVFGIADPNRQLPSILPASPSVKPSQPAVSPASSSPKPLQTTPSAAPTSAPTPIPFQGDI